MSGLVSYCAGLAAEDRIAAEYERRGHRVLQRRWRGQGGEIDLIVQGADGLVFVEVKASRTRAAAARRVSRRQIERLYNAAAEYLAETPDGQSSEVRFDVALMDGGGQIDIIENAFM